MADTCRTCGQPIQWAQTVTGKTMPVDVLPCTDGNVILSHPDDPREPMRAFVLKRNEFTTLDRYTSHFATCPDAGSHRR